MIHRSKGRPPGAAIDHIDGALMGRRTSARLAIGAGILWTSAADVLNHGRNKGAGETVKPIEEEGALVTVAVPAQDQIHAVSLQDWNDILSHPDKVLFGGIIGIM